MAAISYRVLGITAFKAERHLSSNLRYRKDAHRSYGMGILRRDVERTFDLRVVVVGVNPGIVPPLYGLASSDLFVGLY
jgi:hypothetical protein